MNLINPNNSHHLSSKTITIAKLLLMTNTKSNITLFLFYIDKIIKAHFIIVQSFKRSIAMINRLNYTKKLRK